MKIVLLALALIPSVALAANAGDKQDKKRDALICHTTADTGSRIHSQRVCMTREQWDASRREARDTYEETRMRQLQETSPVPAPLANPITTPRA